MDLEIEEIPKNTTAMSTSSSEKTDAKWEEANSPGPSRSQLRSAAIKREWYGFVETSTLHGLQQLSMSQTPLRRIIWAIFLLSGIGWFSFQSFKLLTKYYRYPVTTKVALFYEDAPEFPAVTFCNFNVIRMSALKEMGYKELYTDFIQNTFGLETFNDTMITELMTKLKRVNVTEVYSVTGHQIKDTLFACRWNGEDNRCSYKNFTSHLTPMGLCHTFNAGKDGEQILKVKQEGAEFGLHLILNVQQHDYTATQNRAGFKVLIHHHDTPPMVSQLGFAVGPGTSTFAAMHKQKVVNLPAPYESNCLDKNDTNMPGYTKYTTLGCMETCQAEYVVTKCGCRDSGMPDVSNARVCNFLEIRDCVSREKGNFQRLKGQKCDCPVPCEMISFKPVLSYAAFPSEVSVARLNELVTGPSNVSKDALKKHQEYLSQNFLELTIFFQELNYHIIEQKPEYEVESLLGEIGGQIGLCVGASLLTVLEFCDVILAIIGIRLGIR